MTPSQLADSANAPWTRTIVGCMRRSFRLGDPSRALGIDRSCSTQDRTAAPVVTRPSRALARGDAARLGDGGERAAQLLARADLELGEHLAQVVLDGARADEQPGSDLRVRLPVTGHAGDLRLLRRE